MHTQLMDTTIYCCTPSSNKFTLDKGKSGRDNLSKKFTNKITTKHGSCVFDQETKKGAILDFPPDVFAVSRGTSLTI